MMKAIILALFAIVVTASAGNIGSGFGYGHDFPTGSRFAVGGPVKKPLVTVGFVSEPVVKQHYVTKAVVNYVRVPVTTVTHVIKPFVHNHGTKEESGFRSGPVEGFGSGRLGVTYFKDVNPGHVDLKGPRTGHASGGFGEQHFRRFDLADSFGSQPVYSDLKQLDVTDGVAFEPSGVFGSVSKFDIELKRLGDSATGGVGFKGGFDDRYGFSKGYY